MQLTLDRCCDIMSEIGRLETMKFSNLERKLLLGIVAIFLIMLVGGIALMMDATGETLQADAEIVAQVKEHQDELKMAASQLRVYPKWTEIHTTEKTGLLDPPYDSIKGIYAEIPQDEDYIYESIKAEPILGALNLRIVNHMRVISTDGIVFRKTLMLPAIRSSLWSEEGFYYAENEDYTEILNLYADMEAYKTFQPYEGGYLALGEKDSYLYVEHIVGNFFYYDFVEKT